MRSHRPITRGAVAVVLCVVTPAAFPGPDGPTPFPAVGYHERCAGAMAPALGLSPEGPAPAESHLRRLMKLR